MKLNLIYYKNILDLAMEKFFDIYGDKFVKQDTGIYAIGLGMPLSSIKRVLEKIISVELNAICKDDTSTSDKYILIGSCYPKDNFLLELNGDAPLPKRLAKAIKSRPCLKWVLKEKGIAIDIDAMNSVLESIFNDIFTKPKSLVALLGSNHSNVIAVSHSRLDCYMLFKTIKWAYGNANCKNIWKEDLSGRKELLVSLNEELAKHVANKSLLNISGKFKMYAREVRDYLDSKLGIVRK